MPQQTTIDEMTLVQRPGKRFVYEKLNVAVTSKVLANGEIKNHVEILKPNSRVKVRQKPKRLTRERRMP